MKKGFHLCQNEIYNSSKHSEEIVTCQSAKKSVIRAETILFSYHLAFQWPTVGVASSLAVLWVYT